jgi:cell wall-associated NlpC family hydrolase
VSCKPTSNIITSKSEAQKRGIYRAPENRKLAAKTVSKPNTRNVASDNDTASAYSYSQPKRTETKKPARRRSIDDRNEEDYVVNADNASYMVKQLINGFGKPGRQLSRGWYYARWFDCSGLMYSTFQKFDITLPRSSNDMAKIGRRLDNDEIRKGDLIFSGPMAGA